MGGGRPASTVTTTRFSPRRGVTRTCALALATRSSAAVTRPSRTVDRDRGRRPAPAAGGPKVHVVTVPVAQPFASSTAAWKTNDSPVRRAVREGRTSSRAGGPGESHETCRRQAGWRMGAGACGRDGLGLRRDCGWRGHHLRRLIERDEIERPRAAHVCNAARILEHDFVAAGLDDVDVRVACRDDERVDRGLAGSFAGGVEQRVRHWPAASREWVPARASVGSWS